MPTLDILGSDAAPSATSLFPINYSPPKCLQKRSCSRCDGEPVREQLPCIPPGAAWPPFFTSLNWRIYKPVQAEIVIWISGEMYRIWARKWRVRQDFGCSQRIKLYGIKKKKIPILKCLLSPVNMNLHQHWLSQILCIFVPQSLRNNKDEHPAIFHTEKRVNIYGCDCIPVVT